MQFSETPQFQKLKELCSLPQKEARDLMLDANPKVKTEEALLNQFGSLIESSIDENMTLIEVNVKTYATKSEYIIWLRNVVRDISELHNCHHPEPLAVKRERHIVLIKNHIDKLKNNVVDWTNIIMELETTDLPLKTN